MQTGFSALAPRASLQTNDSFFYTLPVLRVRLSYKKSASKRRGRRPRAVISINGKNLRVEGAAAEFFATHGFVPVRGDDVQTFFNFFMINKKMSSENSLFDDVFLNWGTAHGYRRKELVTLRAEGRALLAEYLAGRHRVESLLNNTVLRWNAYHFNATQSTVDVYDEAWQRQKIAFRQQFIDSFLRIIMSGPDLRKVITAYNEPRNVRGGVPDLFVWDSKTAEWFFAEVKSEKDALRLDQHAWLEWFIKHTGDHALLMRIISTSETVHER